MNLHVLILSTALELQVLTPPPPSLLRKEGADTNCKMLINNKIKQTLIYKTGFIIYFPFPLFAMQRGGKEGGEYILLEVPSHPFEKTLIVFIGFWSE
jgi:hypothetical protein